MRKLNLRPTCDKLNNEANHNIGKQGPLRMRQKKLVPATLLLFAAFIFDTSAQAGSDPDHAATALSTPVLEGIITANGKPVGGAHITATQNSSGIATTVFSNKNGVYSLPLNAMGNYNVHVKTSTQASDTRAINLTAPSLQQLDFELAADLNYKLRITSDQWLDMLPEGEMKREFILNCASCHEIDSNRILVDGKARTKEGWEMAFSMMRGIDAYNILPADFDDAKYIQWLTETFTDEKIAKLEPKPLKDIDQLAKVRITEYPLPESDSLPHDLVIGPKGRIWITAFMYDLMWAMDPLTGEIETYEIRPKGADGWGQARALIFDKDGILWIILGGTHELVALNPETREYKTYNIGMYAHSLAIDPTGKIWFNDYFSVKERIGVFDPATEQVQHINLPSSNLTEAEGLPLPYGLQIDSVGRLYSTQMAGNTVAMYDTRDGSAKLFEMPADNTAPRRPAIGKGDILWVPEWSTGYLSGFDPKTETFTRYKMGNSALGAYDAEVDPRTGEVWVTGALAANMVLFNPDTKTTFEIPLPTNPGFTRHLAVDPQNGDLWSAYSSMPAVMPKVVRIERLE